MCTCGQHYCQECGTKPIKQPPEQVGGHHYQQLSPQPIEVIEAWNLPFHLGCAVKYIARAGEKEGVSMQQDLEKAAWYLNRWRQIHEGPAE